MDVKKIDNIEDFHQFTSSSHLSVVHFSADWSDQCNQVTEVLKELSVIPQIKDGNVQFAVCDAEKLSEISLKYKIDSVPTVLFFNNGSNVDRVDGANASLLTSKVKSYCLDKEPLSPEKLLEEKLKSLINKHKIMVFMKGTKERQMCGFSRTIIQILNETGVEYDTFDILSDEEVRQGLKTYSDWPTYPQLYVNGELVGGLDIVKELKASGQLNETLNG